MFVVLTQLVHTASKAPRPDRQIGRRSMQRGAN